MLGLVRGRRGRRWSGYLVLWLVMVIVLLSSTLWFRASEPVYGQPVVVLRRVDPVAIATQIYSQYPDLPTENHYLAPNGSPVLDDTLVSRLIRYHLYVKDRPANFRLDWKLTLADYLGSFETIDPDVYPSHDALSENPALGDQQALHRMSREQRNQLVQFLFERFTTPPTDE